MSSPSSQIMARRLRYVIGTARSGQDQIVLVHVRSLAVECSEGTSHHDESEGVLRVSMGRRDLARQYQLQSA